MAFVPSSSRYRRSGTSTEGFTIAEILIVLALSGTVLAIGLGFFRTALSTIQGDADMRVIEWQMKLAREAAINQRRSVEVKFTAPNLITVLRRNLPSGTTVLSTIYLEHNTKFLKLVSDDTPDGFGGTGAVAFGSATSMMFTADGKFTDQTGLPLNGTVFLGQPGRTMTARALTIFGPAARIRVFRWNGTKWRQ